MSPPMRPSPLLPVAEPLGVPLPECLPADGVLPAEAGGFDRWLPEEPVDAVPELPWRLPVTVPGRRLRKQGLQRGDLFVYGVEDGGHLLFDVAQLHGQLVAERAPGLAVGPGERGQRLDRTEESGSAS